MICLKLRPHRKKIANAIIIRSKYSIDKIIAFGKRYPFLKKYQYDIPILRHLACEETQPSYCAKIFGGLLWGNKIHRLNPG